MDPINRPAMAEVFFSSFRQPASVNSYKGEFLAVNAAFTAALGWSEDDLRELAYYDLVSASDRRSVIKIGTLVVRHAGSEPRTYRRAFRHKDGSFRLVEWTAWADPKASVVCSIGRVLGPTPPR